VTQQQATRKREHQQSRKENKNERQMEKFSDGNMRHNAQPGQLQEIMKGWLH
jgi:hypothetical protein